MELFKLKVLGNVTYDEFDSFVVRAESEQKARELVNREAGDYGSQKNIWLNPDKVSCNQIYKDGAPKVICASFNAG
jgi:hypothetical protein